MSITDFQIKAISSLLTHKEFLTNIHDIISEEYWDNQAHQWIIKEILRYYDKYHTTPSMDILKVELQKTENHFMQEQSKHMHIADEPLLFTIEEKTQNDYTSEGNY